MSTPLKLLYRADFFSPSGYATAARAHANALIRAGVDVAFEEHKCDIATVTLPPNVLQDYRQRLARTESMPLKIWHETPEFFAPSKEVVNVAMVAWETSRIPSIPMQSNARYNWVEQLNRMNHIFTFCQYARAAMQQSGVGREIEVIPHPIDPATFYPKDYNKRLDLFDTQKQALSADIFKFVSVFQWIMRKDPESLLLAYLTEFRGDEPVALVLKTYVREAGDIKELENRVRLIRDSLRLPFTPAKVYLVPGIMTEAEMGDLYRASDCLVTATRGEGFALTAAEAMSCGVPAIVPNGSAFTDYVTEQNGYLVKTNLAPVHGVVSGPWYNGTQTWHQIDVMDLRRRMREAFTYRKELGIKGQQAAKDIQATCHPNVVGSQMRTSLEQLMERVLRQRTRSQAPTPERTLSPVVGL